MKYKALVVLILITFITSCKSENDSNPVNNEGGDSYYLSLITPNGGENIPEGSNFKIKWTGNLISRIRIHYSTDNGTSWQTIAEEITNSGNYDWSPVPNKPADLCKIKISSTDGLHSDQSDNPFRIIAGTIQKINLLFPAGGEIFASGTKKEILWSSEGIDSVKIQFSYNNGLDWNLLSVIKINNNKYSWDPIPDITTSTGRIRICDAKDSSPNSENITPFSIVSQQHLTITAPSGGEQWISGRSGLIKWETQGVQNVKIEYSTNSGAGWSTISDLTPSNGEYLWENIPSHNSTICKIKISDAADNSPSVVSNNFFTITTQSPAFIRITSPNGGEEFFSGEQKEIIWNSADVNFVNVEFSSDNCSTWQTVAQRNVNNGKINWVVPNTVSVLCWLKVSQSDNSAVMDLTDSQFRISPAKQIQVRYPNGFEVFNQGDSVTVEWNQTSVNYVTVQYSIQDSANGRTWINIAERIRGRFYTKTVFNILSDSYKIRVFDSDYPSLFDESDSVFSVVKRNSALKITRN